MKQKINNSFLFNALRIGAEVNLYTESDDYNSIPMGLPMNTVKKKTVLWDKGLIVGEDDQHWHATFGEEGLHSRAYRRSFSKETLKGKLNESSWIELASRKNLKN